MTFYSRYGKRLFDIFCVMPALLVLSPVLAAVAVMIKLDSPGPVFFLHTRVGRGMRPIRVFKFRTMVVNAERIGPAVTAQNDPRKTRVGAVLRRYKIDELPQLINVLNGSMSLVGPRPEVAQYVQAYPDRYARILNIVKPGITDQAAIEYRDEEGILDKAENIETAYVNEILPLKMGYYEAYLDTISLATDIGLIVRTVRAVFR